MIPVHQTNVLNAGQQIKKITLLLFDVSDIKNPVECVNGLLTVLTVLTDTALFSDV